MGPKRGRSGPSPSSSQSSSSIMERPLLLDHQDAAPSEQQEGEEWWASSSVHHDRDQGVGSGTSRRGGGTSHVRDRERLQEGRERRPPLLIAAADDDPSMAFGRRGGGGAPRSSSRIHRGVDDGLGDTDAFPSRRRHPQGDEFDEYEEFGGSSPRDALPPSRRHPTTDEEEQHRPLLRTMLYRCLLMVGIVVNAALASVLLVSLVGAVLAAEGRPSHPPRGTSRFDSTILLLLRNASSDGGDGSDGSHGAASSTWLWLVSMLAAAHMATAIATAVAVAAGAAPKPPRRGEDDPRGSVVAASNDGQASCAVANRECEGEGDDDDDDDDDNCCCGCGRRHRPLCASTAAVALSGVLLLPAYLALSLLAALGIVTRQGLVGVPDVVQSHGAAALLAIAAFHAVQSRTALLYRRQLRLLRSDETGRRSSSSRARLSSRPWWWQAAATGAAEGELVGGDGSFGWLRLQGRKSSSSRFRWLGRTDNPRDDGSVDFASVQEEWMNRSMEDPYWWSRDHDDNDNDGGGDAWVSPPGEPRWDTGPVRPKRVSPT